MCTRENPCPYLFEFDRVLYPREMYGDHGKEMKDSDDDPCALEGLRSEEEAVVEDDSVHDGKVGADEELETQEEGGETVGYHKRKDECNVWAGDLRKERENLSG